MGFGSRRPTRVPLLNARHRPARLAWARERRDWIVEDWKRVAWSDESEGTMDRRSRSHPPQCTTSREDRQIVRVAVTDGSVTSRTIAQHIESVTHHSVSARTIRRRLQQSCLSARRPWLGLHLTQNHRRLHRQWCDERRMWATE
ncbi:transposable element Tcb1 transposase [Trichonephila clavipes]|nr:transposable element Tcb1 transposase [Trichonephila clavipes]